MSFEDSIKELESIALKLESGECSLDESVELYQKAVVLSKECDDLLKKAKLKIVDINELGKAEQNND